MIPIDYYAVAVMKRSHLMFGFRYVTMELQLAVSYLYALLYCNI